MHLFGTYLSHLRKSVMGPTERESTEGYFVGQKGEFLLLDSFLNPIEKVRGEIVRIMESRNSDSVYVMIATERCIRPARLS